MMTWKHFWKKVRRRLMKLRLQPIRVFCFHQVSDEFEPDTMWECDWMQTEVFKQKILELKKEYTFVPLTEAYHHLANDKIRFKKYATLTADDGWASVKNVLPWLAEQGISITLFLNPKYFDGMHYRERETERFLTEADVKCICSSYSVVSIGMHGWAHVDVSKQSVDEFKRNVDMSVNEMNDYEGFIPFFAFPWGRCNEMNINVLKSLNIVPVLMDGQRNNGNAKAVHRELLTV